MYIIEVSCGIAQGYRAMSYLQSKSFLPQQPYNLFIHSMATSL